MKHLEWLLNAVDHEFAAIEKNGQFRTKDEIELSYKLIDIAKDVYEIWKCEDEMGNGYSENYSMNRGMVYDDGYSNARGRGRDGRYTSRNDWHSYRRGGYSRDDGKEEYLDNLHDLMQNAPDENTRQSIQRMINKMDVH